MKEPNCKSIEDEKYQYAQVNIKALCAALYELSEINCFIADTSRIMQQDALMDDERIVTQGYRNSLAAAIENAAKKELELYDVVQNSIGAELNLFTHKPNVQLFDMPSECTFYHGGYGRKGVLND